MSYCVYCYVFDDGMIYVGLTRQSPKKRDEGHRRKKHGKLMSSVARYANETGQPFPDMLVMYDGLSSSEAQKTEHIIRTSIPEESCLNVKPTGLRTGSLGLPEGPVLTDDQKKERTREYRMKNRDRISEYQRLYYKIHKDEKSKQQQCRRKEDSDRIREYKRRYHIEHKEKENKRSLEYNRLHKEEVLRYEAERRKSPARVEYMKEYRKRRNPRL